jgi:MFS family permease
MSDTPETPPPTERISPPPTERIPPPPPEPTPSPADVAPAPRPVDRAVSRLPGAEELPVLLAAGLVLAVIALAFGALLLAASFDGIDEEWKATVKIIGLSVFGGFDVGIGLGTNALFAAAVLLIALSLVRRDVPPRRAGLVPIVGIGALAIAAWLAFFTLLGLVVDLTELGDDFVAAFGVLLSDLATLLVLALTAVWAYHVYRGARTR